MYRNRFALGAISAPFSLLCALNPAHAQTAPAAGDDAASADPESGSSKEAASTEIIVTAQRRAERIDKVPIVISNFSNEQLEDRGVQRLTDLSAVTPGLNFSQSSEFVFPFIRGLGSLLQSASTNSSVSIYYDGVYLSRPTGQAFDVGNVDSISVLKGPQATLYGRNSTAGAIVIATKTSQPGDSFAGKAAFTLGNYKYRQYSATVGGGLGNSPFAFDLSGIATTQDGTVENLAVNRWFPGEDLNTIDQYLLSGKLTFAPSDGFSVTLGQMYAHHNDSLGYGFQQVNADVAAANLSAVLGGALPPSAFPFTLEEYTSANTSGRRKGSQSLTSLTVKADLGFANLESVGAYFRQSARSDLAAFMTTVDTVGFATDLPFASVSEDLRLVSKPGTRFIWQIGASYAHEKSRPNSTVFTSVFGTISPLTIVRFKRENLAAYVDATYEFSDRFSLTGGVRYSRETARAITDFFVIPSVIGTEQRSKDSDVTYRVIAKYDTGSTIFYVSSSSGVKSGGINSFNPSSPIFSPETVYSQEAGFKSKLLDNRLSVTGAFFYYDIKDIQAQRIGGATGGETFYVNGKKAKLNGVDFDFTYQPSQELQIFGGATWLTERKYGEFNIPASSGLPALVATGHFMAGAPELNAILGFTYSRQFDNESELRITANGNYNSGYWFDVENLTGTGGLVPEDFFTANARISYKLPRRPIEISLYGNNLFEEHYYNAGYTILGGLSAFGLEGNPRQYGVSIAYKF